MHYWCPSTRDASQLLPKHKLLYSSYKVSYPKFPWLVQQVLLIFVCLHSNTYACIYMLYTTLLYLCCIVAKKEGSSMCVQLQTPCGVWHTRLPESNLWSDFEQHTGGCALCVLVKQTNHNCIIFWVEGIWSRRAARGTKYFASTFNLRQINCSFLFTNTRESMVCLLFLHFTLDIASVVVVWMSNK